MSKPKIVAVSRYRYRASAAERRLYGGSTVTEFFVHRAEDARNPERWKIIKGYGPTPGERKTDAIRRSGLLDEPAARDRARRLTRRTRRDEGTFTVEIVNEALGTRRHQGTYSSASEAEEAAQRQAARSRRFATYQAFSGTPRNPRRAVGPIHRGEG